MLPPASQKATVLAVMPPPRARSLRMCCHSRSHGRGLNPGGREPEVPRFSITRCFPRLTLLPRKRCPGGSQLMCAERNRGSGVHGDCSEVPGLR